ncbi:protein XRI1-like [Neltuma alba]|uniref:protein XRI1-like n=1 Tax=Neltuma alba TaxID=207710 RepID=UPI0010A48016|nr:protein XRI1-like [Prosopis alba]XP_028784252.1 protein XRI1-like [Prosopis alba]
MSSELHSLPYSTPSCSFINGSSLWDYHSLGVLNADKMSLVMDEMAPYFSPPELSDFSSGYLEDALLEFTEHSKRRRLLPCVDHEPASKSPLIDIGLEKSLWNFNPLSVLQPAENLYCMNQIESIREFSDEYRRSCMMSRMNEEASILALTAGTPEETVSASESPHSSSSSYNKNPNISKTTDDTIAESDKRKKRVITKVAYPFALVKPGGREGDVTLNDINERILMRPTRPVRHPVGDFACRPCVSAEGPGLSGKEVVALTRIHTQGRGTITIIRTKG